MFWLLGQIYLTPPCVLGRIFISILFNENFSANGNLFSQVAIRAETSGCRLCLCTAAALFACFSVSVGRVARLAAAAAAAAVSLPDRAATAAPAQTGRARSKSSKSKSSSGGLGSANLLCSALFERTLFNVRWIWPPAAGSSRAAAVPRPLPGPSACACPRAARRSGRRALLSRTIRLARMPGPAGREPQRSPARTPGKQQGQNVSARQCNECLSQVALTPRQCVVYPSLPR